MLYVAVCYTFAFSPPCYCTAANSPLLLAFRRQFTGREYFVFLMSC